MSRIEGKNYPADPEQRLARSPANERAVWKALRTVEDPELPVSIVDLGLIYAVEVTERNATIKMTLTYSGCPARDLIREDVISAVTDIDPIDAVEVSLVYSPEWSPERITDRGRTALTEFGLAVSGDGTEGGLQ